MSKKGKINHALKNTLIYRNVTNDLKNIAVSIIKWGGFPKYLSTFELEKYCAVEDGIVALWNPEINGVKMWGAFKVSPADGKVNYQNETKLWRVFLPHNNRTVEVKDEDLIIIKNNPYSIPLHEFISEIAYTMAKFQNAIDKQLFTHSIPTGIVARKSAIKEDTLKKLVKDVVYKDEIFGIIYNTMDKVTEIFEYFENKAPYIISGLMDDKKDVWNSALARLGVKGLDDKKERQNELEIKTLNDKVSRHVEIMKREREKSKEKIKRLMGVDVTIEIDWENVGGFNDVLVEQSRTTE